MQYPDFLKEFLMVGHYEEQYRVSLEIKKKNRLLIMTISFWDAPGGKPYFKKM